MPFGLKFAVWASDLLDHVFRLSQLRERVLVCKCLGAVGTGGVLGEQALHLQRLVAQKLKLKPIRAATQVVSRELHSEVVFECALLGATLDKIATTLRTLQRTEVSEVMESFGETQVGSSAIPVKRNPITSEKISSLARLLHGITQTSLENVALWDERDLSNSANERFTLPVALVVLDEMLDSLMSVVENLHVDTERIKQNTQLTGGQIYSEFILQLLIQHGVSRIDAHRWLGQAGRESSSKGTPFKQTILRHKEIRKHLQAKEIEASFDSSKHFGASKMIINSIIKEVESKCSTRTASSRSKAKSPRKN
jgi:adenylosuccinate lyase